MLISVTCEAVMPRADQIRKQNEQDPGQVARIRQESGSTDFLAIGPALRILQLDVEGPFATRHSIIWDTTDGHNIDIICFQETRVDTNYASRFLTFITSRHFKHGRALYARIDLTDVLPQLSTSSCDVMKIGGYNIANVYKLQVSHRRTPIHSLLCHIQPYM